MDKIFETATAKAPEISVKQRQVMLATKLVGMAKTNYKTLCAMQKEATKAVWYNEHLTPQQACEALGNRAARLFIAHGAITRALVATAQADGVQPDILLPTNDMQINEDGTVTVLDTPYQLV